MTTVTEGGWKGLNTLRHYGVVDGGLFRLLKRRSPAPPGQSKEHVLNSNHVLSPFHFELSIHVYIYMQVSTTRHL